MVRKSLFGFLEFFPYLGEGEEGKKKKEETLDLCKR